MRDIREAMEDLLSEEGLEKFNLLLLVRKEWPLIVGEDICLKTAPYRLEGDVLHVAVDSHATAQDLHYREEKIKEGLQRIGAGEIRRIKTSKVNLKMRFRS